MSNVFWNIYKLVPKITAWAIHHIAFILKRNNTFLSKKLGIIDD